MRFAQNRRACQILFELHKSFFTLPRPDKPVIPLQTLEVQVTLLSTGRYESRQGGHPACELLHLLYNGRTPHHQNGNTLVGICLDSPLSQEKSQKLPCLHAENAVLGIQFQLVLGYCNDNSSRSVTFLLFSRDVTAISSTYACTFSHFRFPRTGC